MKVVAFNGSPRRNGNTARLIEAVLQELEHEGIATTTVQVGGRDLHGCRACYKCRETRDQRCAQSDDILNDCIQAMIGADGIVLGSPTYFADLTPELKALIDRSGFVAKMNGDMLKRKVGAAVVSVRRAGAIHAFDSINHYFTISQMIIPGSSYWNIGIGNEPGAVEKDEEGLRHLRTLGQNMAWLLRRLFEDRPGLLHQEPAEIHAT
jgi:multimeric flavodoxin WrbA